MTDSRLPGRWLTDIRFEQLSDRAWRTFCGSLMWSNEQGTDGRVPGLAMKYLHPLGVDGNTRGELIASKLWRAEKDGISVPEWSGAIGQSSADHVAAQRESNRERQRAHRAKKKATTSSVTDDVTRDVTRESLGEDRQGKDRQETGQEHDAGVDQRTGEVSWPTRVPGHPESWVENDAGEFVPMGRGAA